MTVEAVKKAGAKQAARKAAARKAPPKKAARKAAAKKAPARKAAAKRPLKKVAKKAAKKAAPKKAVAKKAAPRKTARPKRAARPAPIRGPIPSSLGVVGSSSSAARSGRADLVEPAEAEEALALVEQQLGIHVGRVVEPALDLALRHTRQQKQLAARARLAHPPVAVFDQIGLGDLVEFDQRLLSVGGPSHRDRVVRRKQLVDVVVAGRPVDDLVDRRGFQAALDPRADRVLCRAVV